MDRPGMWQPVRSALSFLSDLGGALAFVVGASALVTAAVGGAVLVALDVLPQPFLTLMTAGIGMGAAGFVLHLLRHRLRPPVRAASAEAPTVHPNDAAAALQRAYERVHGDQATRDSRKARRCIREELLDNRRVLGIVRDGHMLEPEKLSLSGWRSAEEVLLLDDDPLPHRHASSAYREIMALHDSQYSRTGSSVVRRSAANAQPLDAELRAAIDAIDAAIRVLDEET